jgi:hypothetical protein
MKGQDMHHGVNYIVLVVAIIILLLFGLAFFTYMQKSKDRSVCSVGTLTKDIQSLKDESILADIASRAIGVTSYSLSCPTKFSFVTKKDIETLDRKELAAANRMQIPLQTTDSATKAQFQTDYLMADGLTECYKQIRDTPIFDAYYKVSKEQLNQLKYNGFWAKAHAIGLDLLNQQFEVANPRFCAVCHKVQFSPSVQSSKTTDLESFLAATTDPTIKERSVLDALKGASPNYKEGHFSYTTQETQAIVFMKRHPFESTLGEQSSNFITWGTAGVLVGVATVAYVLSAPVSVPVSIAIGIGAAGTVAVVGGTAETVRDEYLGTIESDLLTGGPYTAYRILPYSKLSEYCDIIATTYGETNE